VSFTWYYSEHPSRPSREIVNAALRPPYFGCRFDAVPRIAYADLPGGAGKAIIKFRMPRRYQLRHGSEEKSRRCRRVMTPGQLARTITAQLSVNRDSSRSNAHIKGERADSRPMSGLNGISAALTPIF